MKAKSLSFAFFYFYESGLFNWLPPNPDKTPSSVSNSVQSVSRRIAPLHPDTLLFVVGLDEWLRSGAIFDCSTASVFCKQMSIHWNFRLLARRVMGSAATPSRPLSAPVRTSDHAQGSNSPSEAALPQALALASDPISSATTRPRRPLTAAADLDALASRPLCRPKVTHRNC
jgi:hypothetical protein